MRAQTGKQQYLRMVVLRGKARTIRDTTNETTYIRSTLSPSLPLFCSRVECIYELEFAFAKSEHSKKSIARKA